MTLKPSLPRAYGAAEGQKPKVSVIITLGKRFEDLGSIVASLRRILPPVIGAYEVIIIDDACADADTRLQMRQLGQQFTELRLIRLQRSMGEAAVLSVGAHAAQGDVLLILDPYLHVALDDLPALLKPIIHEGRDIVCGWRYPRKEKGLSRLASDAFNSLARHLTKVNVHDLNCRTRAMRRVVLQEMPMYGDLHRFLPILASRRGYSWCEVKVAQLPGKREIGAFSLHSYFHRAFDLLTLWFLTRFVKRPLHFFGVIGLTNLAVGLGITLYLAAIKLFAGEGIGHRPILLLGVLLLVVGIQIASIGLLGELIIFTHARDQKEYAIKDDLGPGDA